MTVPAVSGKHFQCTVLPCHVGGLVGKVLVFMYALFSLCAHLQLFTPVYQEAERMASNTQWSKQRQWAKVCSAHVKTDSMSQQQQPQELRSSKVSSWSILLSWNQRVLEKAASMPSWAAVKEILCSKVMWGKGNGSHRTDPKPWTDLERRPRGWCSSQCSAQGQSQHGCYSPAAWPLVLAAGGAVAESRCFPSNKNNRNRRKWATGLRA